MLRERQVQGLTALLQGDSFEWSALVLDKEGQDIISPLFVMSDLMEMGIVQCLKMEDKRVELPGIRVVYFVEATEQNTGSILQDIEDDLYERIEIIFTGIISTSLLKDFSLKVAALKQANRITRITDAITTISLLHEDIYSLNMDKSYVRTTRISQEILKDQAVVERPMEEHNQALAKEKKPSADDSAENDSLYYEHIVMGLCSVFKDTEIPAIYYNDPVAQRVSTELVDKLSDISEVHQRQTTSKTKRRKKPLLIVLSRDEDLVGPMYHTNLYGSVLNEVFEFSMNKLVISDPINKQDLIDNASYNLNKHDSFYNKNINEPFLSVLDIVNGELQNYKDSSHTASINMSSDNDKMIRSLVKLPGLLNNNKLLYNHMNIVLNAIKVIQKKHLDELFLIEEGNALDLPEIEEIIDKIDRNDVIRLNIVVFSKFSRQFNEVSKLSEKHLKNDKIVNYVKNRTVQQSTKGKILHNLKKMIGVQKDGIIRRVHEVFSRQTEEYSSVNVFIIGGGTYDEYKSVLDFGRANKIDVTYGSTEILSAYELMAQIEEIE
ncbi:sec1 family domain-containing protein 1 [Nematocida ausubeli]|nr:sec1 family domain-containing protein 1 [Nematocida ausubeli]